jgi:hypothetical protein
MNQKFELVLKAFYEQYVASGSNVTEFAQVNGLTPTECFQLVAMGSKRA